MAGRVDLITINNRELDRRVKLTLEQRAEIAKNQQGLSQRALARMYGVSRRTITFILDPSKQAENLKRRKERGGAKIYYNKDMHRESMREHREYKRQLIASGKIGGQTNDETTEG